MDLSFLEIKDVLGDIKKLGEGGIDSLNFLYKLFYYLISLIIDTKVE